MIRGNGQKSVVRIFGSSISFASKGVRGATGGSSDDSSHATCDTFAYRYPQDVGLRLAARSIELRRGGVANGCAIWETVGSKPLPLESGEARKRPIERHDGTRPAHAPCGLTRFMAWELGSRRSDSPDIGASRCTAQEAAVWQSDPNRAVPVRTTTDARGRTRPSEAPPAAPMRSARGVGTGAKSSTGSERSLHNVPRHGASVREIGRSGRALRRVT